MMKVRRTGEISIVTPPGRRIGITPPGRRIGTPTGRMMKDNVGINTTVTPPKIGPGIPQIWYEAGINTTVTPPKIGPVIT